jgi:hypothetical protein
MIAAHDDSCSSERMMAVSSQSRRQALQVNVVQGVSHGKTKRF